MGSCGCLRIGVAGAVVGVTGEAVAVGVGTGVSVGMATMAAATPASTVAPMSGVGAGVDVGSGVGLGKEVDVGMMGGGWDAQPMTAMLTRIATKYRKLGTPFQVG